MSKTWNVASVVVILLLPSLAQEQHSVRMKGNSLAANCEHFRNCERSATCTNEDLSGFGMCAGYISGVSDAVHEDICIPTEVETGQIVKTVIKWMDENPNLLHHDANTIVLKALNAGFPCTRH